MDNFNGTKSSKIIRTVLFFVIGALVFAGVAALSVLPATSGLLAAASGADASLCQGIADVTPAILRVQEESDATKLVIGDSVCQQLFADFADQNPAYCFAGTYCTVGLNGQYLLANEFLNSHPDATDIYLIIRPQSMSARLDSQKAYMYSVAPFIVTGTADALDEETVEEMRRMYWSYGINRVTATAIVNSPMLAKIYLNKLTEEHYVDGVGAVDVPEISVRCLDKIAKLCKERGVTFHFLANPLPDDESNRAMVEYIAEQTKGTAVEALVEDLCSSVVYCDESDFLDGQHFDFEQIEARDVITLLQQKNQDLLDLDLGAE